MFKVFKTDYFYLNSLFLEKNSFTIVFLIYNNSK